MGFAGAINEMLDTWWGTLISAWYVIGSIWTDLFDMPKGDTLPPPGACLGRADRRQPAVPLAPLPAHPGVRGGPVSALAAERTPRGVMPPAPAITDRRVVIENVSKFYGEVLGVNHVNLSIPPGITSLVGPNGSGKTTLMNLWRA